MHIAFGHDACEWRGHAEIPFHVTNGVECLTRRFGGLLRRDNLIRTGIGGLFGNHDVITGDDARRCRRGFQSFEGRFIRISLGSRHGQLRLGSLQLGLRLRPLRHDFRRLERDQQVSGANARASVHVDGLHESGHSRKDRHCLKGRQLARQ